MVANLEVRESLEPVAKKAHDYAADAVTPNTRRAYRSDRRRFDS